MVESLGENRIDVFARKERSGWDVFGDEVKNSVFKNLNFEEWD